MPQQFDTILPEGFDGTFRFTNASDEDFIGKWDSKEYLFRAQSTTPMMILNATPLEVQNIRKKFARDWAEREFFKSKRGMMLSSQERNSDGTPKFNSIHMAATYSDDDLAPFIQQCLTPLPIVAATVAESPKVNLEDSLTRDDEGEIVTQAVDKNTSLRKKALEKNNGK